MIRIAKLGRMQKLVKLTRLIKIVKLVRNKKSVLSQAKKIFGAGFERLSFFILGSLMVTHIFACLWVFFSSFSDEDEDSFKSDLEDISVG